MALGDNYHFIGLDLDVVPSEEVVKKAIVILGIDLCAKATICPKCGERMKLVEGRDYTREYFLYTCPSHPEVRLGRS